jgi:mannose-6-phosphate isomerase-like protein (cupin superfamily)
VTSGELVFTIARESGEVEETVRAGDAVVVAANSYHGVRNVSQVNATLLDIACYKHQQFFDQVDQEHQSWKELTPEETMVRVGEIALNHTLEFRVPG